RVVLEYPASPGAQNDCVVTLGRGNRQDLSDSALQGPTDFIAACRVLLQHGSCIGSGRTQKRARKRSFQELPVVVTKNNNGGRVNHVVCVERVAMALVERVHRPAIKTDIKAR